MTTIPSTQYAKNGDFTLAYQVAGMGRQDLIYLLFETPNVVANWFVPEHVRFMERLASFSRLVITDRRGMGCSDRLAPGTSPVLEDLVDDLLVVMETANAFSATLLAGAETAFIALLAAATHPDRVERLILWGPSPSWQRSDDLPTEASPDQIEATLGVDPSRHEPPRMGRDLDANNLPSWVDDPAKVALWEALSALVGLGRSLVPGPADVLRHRPSRRGVVDPHADADPRAPEGGLDGDPERSVPGGTDAERFPDRARGR